VAGAEAEDVTRAAALEDSGAGKVTAAKAVLAAGKGIRRIARDLQAGVGTALRTKAELAAA
jgi:hypothetical protein